MPGDVIEGPAIIVEANSTTVVEAGWRAETDRFGPLILTRVRPRHTLRAVGTDADPVMLEIFNNLFMSIAEQMGAILANTAYSVNIKDAWISPAPCSTRAAIWSPTRPISRAPGVQWGKACRR